MHAVFVVDQDWTPLPPCHPARARQLLRQHRAAILRRQPFTIILTDLVSPAADTGGAAGYTVKLDPGARTTGIALVRQCDHRVVWAAELTHRGFTIRKRLLARRQLRRARRQRKTRYRQPRFENRRRPAGWLPPSLESRIANVQTWVDRLRRFVPVTDLALELVKFDTQQLVKPEIAGAEYQQGTLAGYEVRAYLLEKWGHRCAYCPKPQGVPGKPLPISQVPLQVEHIVPRARGGSSRVSNLTLACRACNERKGTMTAAEFGHPAVQAQALRPLKDAAAVNSTRWALYRRLQATGIPIETGSGGRTAWNRTNQGYPKAHWIDAACASASGAAVRLDPDQPVLAIDACGHGKRQRCGTDRFGFPIRHAPRRKTFCGYQTGDLVRARIPSGRHRGTHVGRVAIRFRPSFRLGDIDVHPKYLTRLQRADGYVYHLRTGTTPRGTTEDGASPVA